MQPPPCATVSPAVALGHWRCDVPKPPWGQECPHPTTVSPVCLCHHSWSSAPCAQNTQLCPPSSPMPCPLCRVTLCHPALRWGGGTWDTGTHSPCPGAPPRRAVPLGRAAGKRPLPGVGAAARGRSRWLAPGARRALGAVHGVQPRCWGRSRQNVSGVNPGDDTRCPSRLDTGGAVPSRPCPALFPGTRSRCRSRGYVPA